MIATLVEKGTYILKNVPNLMDIRTLVKLLESLGLIIERLDNNTYKIENRGLTNLVAGYELVKKMRASFLVMGPMLAHCKKLRYHFQGGVLLVLDR